VQRNGAAFLDLRNITTALYAPDMRRLLLSNPPDRDSVAVVEC
jgi:hypothetical protein